MDPIFLLGLVIAAVVALVAVRRIASRPESDADEAAKESSIGVSTEGSKICPHCGMGNLWTERTCSSCGTALKG